MKNLFHIFVILFLFSCTSNTIFEKPKDLIPKDTMELLIHDMMVATSAKSIKNINLEKKVNYMPFVFDKYRIDSVRFQTSNLYYVTKIDLYQEIFEGVKAKLEIEKDKFTVIKSRLDSVRRDSIKKLNIEMSKKVKQNNKKDKFLLEKEGPITKPLKKNRKFNTIVKDKKKEL